MNSIPTTFHSFDYRNPPESGLYWIAYTIPEYDCDVDDCGRSIGWATGKVVGKVAMVWLDVTQEDNSYEFDCTPVDSSNLGDVPEEATLTHYREVKVPAYPEQLASADCKS